MCTVMLVTTDNIRNFRRSAAKLFSKQNCLIKFFIWATWWILILKLPFFCHSCPQQTFLASRIRISNKSLFWFSVGIHGKVVVPQVFFSSNGVLLVVTFLVVWLVLHDRVCSILGKIFKLVVLSIIHLDSCFSIRRVLLKKPQMKKAQKMTKKKYVVKNFYQLL